MKNFAYLKSMKIEVKLFNLLKPSIKLKLVNSLFLKERRKQVNLVKVLKQLNPSKF